MKSRLLPLVVLVLLLAGGVLSYVYQSTHHKAAVAEKVTVDIGAYQNLEAEQLASIQRLSVELYQHPEANAVRIIAGKSAWRQGVMGYVKNSSPGSTNLFWYDDRFSSPTIGYVNGRMQGIRVTHLVSEQPIHDAACRHGLPSDMTLYNDKLRVKLGLDLPDAIVPPKTIEEQ